MSEKDFIRRDEDNIPELGFRDRPLDALRKRVDGLESQLSAPINEILAKYDNLMRLLSGGTSNEEIVLAGLLQPVWGSINDLIEQGKNTDALDKVRAVKDYLVLVASNPDIKNRDLSPKSSRINVNLDDETEEVLTDIIIRLNL